MSREAIGKPGEVVKIDAKAVAKVIGKDPAPPQPKRQARSKSRPPSAPPPVRKSQIKVVAVDEPRDKQGVRNRTRSAQPRRNRLTKKQIAEMEAGLVS